MPSIFAFAGSLALNSAPYVAGMKTAAKVTDDFVDTVAEAISSSITLGGNLEMTENSLKVFTGSMRRAKEELAAVDKLSRNTVGLRLVTAEEGYQRLRALGFEAQRTRDLIKELGEEKILSATTDENLQRVIFNFTQIASGGQRISQEIRELLTAMPSLKRSFMDAFGSLDPKKIQSMLDADPNQFFDKLISAMKKGEAAAGGFNDAQDKLYDQFIRSGREFSKPFLPQLTQSLKELTKDLEANKDLFASWGTSVGRWLTFVSNIGETKLFSLARAIQELSDRGAAFGMTFGMSGGATFGELGKEVRGYLDALNVTTKGKDYLTGETNASRAVKDAKKQAQDAIDTAGEALVNIANVELEAQAAITRAIASQLALIEGFYNDRINIIDSAFQVEEARLTSHLDFTLSDELKTIKAVSAAKSKGIREQIKEAESYYRNLLSLNSGDKAATTKITLERNQTLRGLNKDLIVNELNTQKQIAEKEQAILDQRRKAFIDLKKILISENQFNLDVAGFNVSEARSGFAELIDLTNQSYAEISRLSIESYQLQLQEQSLSKEERFNLTKQMYLDEQKLAEDNRRAILDIQKNQYQEEARLITQAADFMRSSADARAGIHSHLINEFNEGFNFVFPDFLENFGSQLIQESETVIQTLRGKIDAAREDLLDLKTFPDEVFKKYELTTKEQMQGAQSYIESAIGAMEGEVRILEQQAIDIQNATVVIGQAVGDYLEKFDALRSKFGKLSTGNLVDYKLGLNTIVEADELNKLEARIKRTKELMSAAGKFGQQFEAEKLAYDLVDLENKKADAIAAFAQKRIDIVRESAQGLKLILDDIKAGGDNAVFIQEAAQSQVVQEMISGYREIAVLKERIASFSNYQALEIEKAQLQEILTLRGLETQKIIEGNRSMMDRVNMMQAQLPSASALLNDSFMNAIEGMSSGFANAVTEWDGTFKGFLTSVAQNFAQTMQQIINELIRVAVMKFILDMIGRLSGGGGGSASDAGGVSGGTHLQGGVAPGHFASGGYTGDIGRNQIAGFVHGQEYVMNAASVSKFGKGFFNNLNSGVMPTMAGGSSSTTTTDQRSYQITVVMPPNSHNSSMGNQRAGEQVAREVLINLRKHEQRNK